MGFFSKPNLLTASQMNRNDIKNPDFQKFLKKNPKLSKILDKKEEVREFFNTIKEEAGKDGLSEADLKSALYVLKNKGGSSISHEEIRGMAKEFFPNSSNPYIRREKPAEKSSQPKKVIDFQKASVERAAAGKGIISSNSQPGKLQSSKIINLEKVGNENGKGLITNRNSFNNTYSRFTPSVRNNKLAA